MNEIPKVVFSKNPKITDRSNWTKVESIADSTKAPAGKRAPASVTAANEKSWLEARVMSGDLKKDIAQLKSEPGNDLIAWGGVGFARSLLREGLVDEIDLMVYPVAIGQGEVGVLRAARNDVTRVDERAHLREGRDRENLSCEAEEVVVPQRGVLVKGDRRAN